MDAEIDFIQPELLDILVLEQKNLIIYPYVDLKNLHILDVFALDDTLIELDATMLHNLEEIVKMETAEVNVQYRTIFLIYNVKTEDIIKIMNIKSIRCIINTNEDIRELSDYNKEFIIYNKKVNKFLNYSPQNSELNLASHVISSSKNLTELKLELSRIKYLAERIFHELNKDPGTDYLPILLKDYDQQYWTKILTFTKKYFNITISEFDLSHNPNQEDSQNLSTASFEQEFQFIHNLNTNLSREFLLILHDYRTKKVNARNLELDELYYPEKLYVYLRCHHWKKEIDFEFLKDWIQMLNTHYNLTDHDIEDFQKICERLRIPPEIIDELLAHKPKVKEQVLIEKNMDKSQDCNISKSKQVPESFPSVENFNQYKKWVLKALDEIDKLLDQSS